MNFIIDISLLLIALFTIISYTHKGFIKSFFGVCKCGMVQTSTFEILDTRCNQIEIFTYETGMTWSEWLNSKYNTGIGSCIAIWVSEEHNILGCNPNMDIYVNGDRADYDSEISEKDIIELVKY
jgi:hypothetical protein